jgi:hypothetical protein
MLKYLCPKGAAKFLGVRVETIKVITELGWLAHYRQDHPRKYRYDIDDLKLFQSALERLIATDPEGLTPSPLREQQVSSSKGL